MISVLICLVVALPSFAAEIGVLMRPTPIYIAPDTTSQRLTLAQRGVIDPQSTAQGVDPQTLGGGDEVDSPWHRIEEGQPRARITRMALGDAIGKEKAGSGLGQDASVATTLGRAMAFALHDWGNGGVIRMHDCALGQLFALGQAPRLLGDLPMRVAGGFQVTTQALTLRLTQGAGLMQARLGVLGPGLHATAQIQHVLCGLTHQFDEDCALAPALTTKATHDFLQGLVPLMSWVLQSGGRERALRTDPLDEVQDFFGALYSVVASVTR